MSIASDCRGNLWFFKCVLLSQAWWLNRVWHCCLCRNVIKALCCAIRCSYGRNKGASWSKSKKWGACFDTLCFRSNTQGSQYCILAKSRGQEILWCLLMIKMYFFKKKYHWDSLTVCDCWTYWKWQDCMLSHQFLWKLSLEAAPCIYWWWKQTTFFQT